MSKEEFDNLSPDTLLKITRGSEVNTPWNAEGRMDYLDGKIVRKSEFTKSVIEDFGEDEWWAGFDHWIIDGEWISLYSYESAKAYNNHCFKKKTVAEDIVRKLEEELDSWWYASSVPTRHARVESIPF